MKVNPILEKDLKTKLRGWRSTILISGYVLLLILILYLFFAGNNMIGLRYNFYSFNPRVAVNGYNLLITFQFALLFLAVPALTATAVSNERERQTLDLMLVTQTSARKIIMGKIMVSLAHTMLMVVASLPVIGVVFLFGGIGFADILKLLLFYIVTGFFVACCGVFFSSVFRKNITSIITTYIFLGLVAFGPIIGLIIYFMFWNQAAHASPNPSYGTFAAILFPSPVFGFLSLYFSGSSAYYGYTGGVGVISSLAQEIQNQIAMETGIWKYMQPWLVNGLFSVISSFFLILFSSLILNPVKRRRRRSRGVQ